MQFESWTHRVLVLFFSLGVLAPAKGQVEETWDAAYQGTSKIGYANTITDWVDAGGQKVIRTKLTTLLKVLRGGSTMTVEQFVETFELADGRLYAFNSRMKSPSAITTRGRLVEAGKFVVDFEVGGETRSETKSWSDDIVGPQAYRRLLREKRIAANEVRTLRTFLPDFNTTAKITIKGRGKEKTSLAAGDALELDSAEVAITVDGADGQPAITLPSSIVWIDMTGNILKERMELPTPGGAIEIFMVRVTKAEALRETSAALPDLLVKTLIEPDRPLPSGHDAKRVVYRLDMGDENAAKSIPVAAYQRVLSKEGTSVRIEVVRTTPPAQPAGGSSEGLGDYLAPSGFIQADDPAIVATANQVAGSATDPWQKAVALERWVDANMTNRDFSVGFASAAEVMKTKQGDCTEHAVLLAALCRAAKIPARVATGLVYVESLKKFGFHMWTEINIGGVWYPIDGTLAKAGIGGGHIKLSDSSLKGVSAMSDLLAIFNVIGKIKISIEAAE